MVRKNSTNEEIEAMGIELENPVSIFIDKTGKDCEEYNAVAKTINANNNAMYYIKYRRGELFDPYGIDALKTQARDTKYKKVDKYIFDNYLKYLQTRRSAFLLEARRDFIRKGY